MKNVLAFTLVLALATVAQAGFILGDDGAAAGDIGTTSVLSVSSDAANSSFDLSLVATSGDVTFDVSGITFATYDFAGTVVSGSSATNQRVSASQFFGAAHAAGTVLINNVVVNGLGTMDLVDMAASGAVVGSFNVVPEPMTMSLLALGGLGLLRRRRA